MFGALHNLLVILSTVLCAVHAERPNILFIMHDDGGYADVSYHGAEFQTPMIDKLASEGVKLENYYVLPMCSPTRAAFMTGRHPVEFGLRSVVQQGGNGMGVPLNYRMLPEKLLDAGYETHQIGKWHLGQSSWIYTPIGRGFDTSFCTFGGILEYYTHDRNTGGRDDRFDPREPGPYVNWGYDLWFNQKPVGDLYKGVYSTYLFTDRAIDIINEHEWASPEKENPFFIWLGYTAPHAPYQAPNILQERFCSHIVLERRRRLCGMMRALDDDLGRIMDTLEANDYLDNTLIVLMSDNGGMIFRDASPPQGSVLAAQDNTPLRNGKASLFDGGTRSYAFVWGNMLQDSVTGTENNELFHVADWHLTLLDVAGTNPRQSYTRTTDSGQKLAVSFNQWSSLSTGTSGPRHELLYHVLSNDAIAVRNDDFKLYVGTNLVRQDGWFTFQPNQPDRVLCGPPPLHNITCRQRLPEQMFFNIREDPEELSPIEIKIATAEEQKNLMELEDLCKNWLSIIPPQQKIIADSQFLAEYWDCHFHPFISAPGYPVTPIHRDINSVDCPQFQGADNWRQYA